MKLTKSTIYIGLFAILYLIVAFSSFYHAVAFFGLANNSWMSVILAFAFEIGQAAVLFSLLTSKKDRSRVMPWILMTMFTLVQVIGNVFSSYKYIITNSVENLRYFKEPIFIWTTIPDDQATVIIVYLVGALLPIAALFLTSMITNYLTDQSEEKQLENKILNNDGDSLLNQNSILQMEKQSLEEFNKKKDDEINQLKKQLENVKNGEENKSITEEQSNNDMDEQQFGRIENQAPTKSELSENKLEDIELKNVEKDQNKKESHFVNL